MEEESAKKSSRFSRFVVDAFRLHQLLTGLVQTHNPSGWVQSSPVMTANWLPATAPHGFIFVEPSNRELAVGKGDWTVVLEVC